MLNVVILKMFLKLSLSAFLLRIWRLDVPSLVSKMELILNFFFCGDIGMKMNICKALHTNNVDVHLYRITFKLLSCSVLSVCMNDW